jgi:hypothetical protein
VNRRQRRIQGHRGAARQLLQAIVCPDCDSDVAITEVAPDVYQGTVEHDDSCPWFAAFKRAGGLGIRFGHTPDDQGNMTAPIPVAELIGERSYSGVRTARISCPRCGAFF